MLIVNLRGGIGVVVELLEFVFKKKKNKKKNFINVYEYFIIFLNFVFVEYFVWKYFSFD